MIINSKRMHVKRNPFFNASILVEPKVPHILEGSFVRWRPRETSRISLYRNTELDRCQRGQSSEDGLDQIGIAPR